MTTVSIAKQFLKDNWVEGTTCLCCGQTVKLYKRSITSSMAYSLIKYSENQVGAYKHAQTYFHERGHMYAGGGDFPKLRFWGLIEKRGDSKEDGNPNSGYYAITQKGLNFVNNDITVPKYMYIYLNKVRKQSEEQVNIVESLGNSFRYSDLVSVKKSPVREMQTSMFA